MEKPIEICECVFVLARRRRGGVSNTWSASITLSEFWGVGGHCNCRDSSSGSESYGLFHVNVKLMYLYRNRWRWKQMERELLLLLFWQWNGMEFKLTFIMYWNFSAQIHICFVSVLFVTHILTKKYSRTRRLHCKRAFERFKQKLLLLMIFVTSASVLVDKNKLPKYFPL